MGGREAQHYWEHVGLMMLIGGFLLGPLAWFVDLQVSYAVVKWACRGNGRAVLLLMPLGSLTLVAFGAWLSWACWTKLRGSAQPEGGRMEDRSYFLALAGLASNAIFGLLILTSLAPRYFLSPCE
jgi:hypothetical protein